MISEFVLAPYDVPSDAWDGRIRRARVLRSLPGTVRARYWEVAVDPAIPRMSVNDEPASVVILAERHVRGDLSHLGEPGVESPLHVYVCCLNHPVAEGVKVDANDLSIRWWAIAAAEPEGFGPWSPLRGD